MSAYHATHESPYDDACPDCTGMDAPDEPEPHHWARSATVAAYLAAAAVALYLVVTRWPR